MAREHEHEISLLREQNASQVHTLEAHVLALQGSAAEMREVIRDKDARLAIQLGRRYGLVGKNGSG